MGFRSIFIAILAFPVLSFAQLNTEKVGHCQVQGEEFAVLLEEGKPLSDGQLLALVSSKTGSATGLPLNTTGKLDLLKNEIRASPHWGTPTISLSDCVFNQAPVPLTESLWTQTPMVLQSYFVMSSQWPIQEEIDDLVLRGEAFPVKIEILCRSKGTSAPTSPLGCDKIEFLQKVIPVGPPPVASPVSAVVQIQSKFCSGLQSVTTSGVSIDWQGKQYVLTSAYSVLGVGSQLCHRIITPDRAYKAKIVRQSWIHGLALLELEAGRLPMSAQLAPINGDWPLKATLELFDVDKADFASQSVSVLSDSSSRHFIPGIHRTAEIKGASFHSSATGAPLFSSGGVIGLVTHEYLKIFPGSLTRPLKWNFGAKEMSDHLVVVRAEDIVAWLSSPVADDQRLLFSADDALANAATVSSGLLAFSEDCPELDPSKTEDEYPIGGGDAYGIGGDGNNYRACKIKVTLAKEGTKIFLEPSQQKFHDDLVAALQRGQSVEIYFRISRDAAGRFERAYLYSTDSFMQTLLSSAKSPGVQFVYTLSDATRARIGDDPKLQTLRELAGDAATKSKQTYSFFASGDPLDGEIIREAYFISKMLESEQWSLIQESDFDHLVRPQGEIATAWSRIKAMVPGASKLYGKLGLLYAEWKNVK
ncbi:MAG: hypothetical protein IPJ84_00270 [Bdellovibrionales bacterium]|nr:hypothetical protein [Bdellovibrionales bacterium]